MNTLFLGVLISLVGAAYSSCLIGIYTDADTGDTTVCKKGCCGDFCCIDLDDIVQTESLAVGWIVFIVIAAVIAKVVFWILCCYFVCRRRQQTVIIMPPQPTLTSVSVHNSNPMHAGYDQAYSRPPPYDAGKPNGV